MEIDREFVNNSAYMYNRFYQAAVSPNGEEI